MIRQLTAGYHCFIQRYSKCVFLNRPYVPSFSVPKHVSSTQHILQQLYLGQRVNLKKQHYYFYHHYDQQQYYLQSFHHATITTLDSEQSLKKRGWGKERPQPTQKEMKYALPTRNAKFPLVESMCPPVSQIFNPFPLGLLDGHIDFDQWVFCVVWATCISFLTVLSAVPSFLNPFSFRDCS